MKKLRNLTITMFAVAFMTQLAFVAPAFAQSAKQIERERLSRVMDKNANVEEFRQEMLKYFSEMEEPIRLFNEVPAVRERYAQSGLKPIEKIVEAKRQIIEASIEDLILIRSLYAKVPYWRELPKQINSLIKPEFRQRLQASLNSKNYGGVSMEDLVDDCAFAIQQNHTNTDISIARGFALGASAVMEGFPTDVVSIAARLIPIAAWAVAEAAVIGIETLKAIKDDCTELDASSLESIVNNAKTEIINNDNSNKSDIINNDNSNATTLNTAITNARNTIVSNDNTNTTTVTTAITNAQTSINNTGSSNTSTITTAITNSKNEIITNDNTNRTTIVNNDNSNATMLNTNVNNTRNAIITNDNTNTTNIVNNDNANKTMIVNNDNSNAMALNDLVLRSQIEADLATESNGVKVAWYMTPTANGGKLDLVQQIVTLTLANIKAAGGSIGNAQSFLNKANADKAAGNFKSAYDNYRKAYKAAAN